jgi:regulatory protein
MARRQPAGGDHAAGAATRAAPPLDPADPALQDPEPDPESVARTICLRLLTARARSRAELAEALRIRNVPDNAAGRVLDRLAEVGLVNDNAFAADFVHAKRAERGLAGRELSRQLRGKGVADEVIAGALADLDEDAERAVARRLAERKLKGMTGLDTQAQIRRLAGMLARKGYSPGVAFQVVREVVGEAASEHYDAETMLG